MRLSVDQLRGELSTFLGFALPSPVGQDAHRDTFAPGELDEMAEFVEKIAGSRDKEKTL